MLQCFNLEFHVYLTVEKACQSHKQNFKDTRLEECDLIIMVQAFEAWNELGKGAHLAHMVHEPFTELLHERVLGPAFHGTCLK